MLLSGTPIIIEDLARTPSDGAILNPAVVGRRRAAVVEHHIRAARAAQDLAAAAQVHAAVRACNRSGLKVPIASDLKTLTRPAGTRMRMSFEPSVPALENEYFILRTWRPAARPSNGSGGGGGRPGAIVIPRGRLGHRLAAPSRNSDWGVADGRRRETLTARESAFRWKR